jgi:dUTP pyrophosphatase
VSGLAGGFRVTRLHPQATLPTRAHPGDAGLDLYANEPAELAPGERAMISTGIAVEVPVDHAGLVMPRSGNAAKHGIALVNAPGLIDAGYRGELKILLLNTDRVQTFKVNPGDRIAQLVLTPIATPEVVEVEQLSDHVRGQGGFGSSGI